MRESIGGTWLFQIVIVFILLFTGYICLTINHSKAFAVKDDIIEIIERYNGIDLTTTDPEKNPVLGEISDKLSEIGYRTSGNCDKLNRNSDSTTPVGQEWHGFDRDGKAASSNNASFCIRQVSVSNSTQTKVGSVTIDELPDMVYYQIGVFYQLDLPVLNSLMSFSEKGDTRIIYNPGK